MFPNKLTADAAHNPAKIPKEQFQGNTKKNSRKYYTIFYNEKGLGN